jgi:phospholipase A-2-activating protein
MVGHSSLVCSVAAHSSGIIASGSEDLFAKLWRDVAYVQIIEHPGSVWNGYGIFVLCGLCPI